MADQGEFNLIIEKVTSPDAATFLSEAFGLDPQLTGAMLKTTPIIFATHLSKTEVKALTPRLQELSKRGFEFRITGRTAKLPKVNWLARPNFSMPTTGSTSPIAFDFQGTAFVCPTCGDTFAFTRVGPIPLSDPSTPPPASTNTPAASIKPVAAPVMPKKSNSPTEPLKLELSENAGATPSGGQFADADLVEPLTDEALESGDISKKDGVPEIDLSSIEAPPDGASESSAVKTSVDISAALDESLSEVETTPQPKPGEELFNVFVPEVKDKQRLEDVVKLVSQIRNIPEDEARKLTRRLMIPVAKGVSKDEAEKILSQFKKIKTTGRMTKVNPMGPTPE